MGASMLAIYSAKKGTENPLVSQVGISCHFESFEAFKFVSTNLSGVLDNLLGVAFRI